MAKIGDTVRFLNSTGGGRITAIDGKIAYVEEDGFAVPVLLKDVVVVLPAGHEPSKNGARLMFDQSAFDAGRKTDRPKAGPRQPELEKETPAPTPPPQAPVELTRHGDKLSLALVFEPSDIKRLSTSKFNAVLVNDSNYTLTFAFMRRAYDERGWTLVFAGEAAPNECMDLATLSHETLGQFERIAIQAFASRTDAPFERKPVVDIERKLDLAKFHKLHCFRPGIYFDTPVLEIQLMDRDREKGIPVPETDMRALQEKFSAAVRKPKEADRKSPSKHNADPGANPHKLLPLIEIDLHIDQLVDSTAGMDNTAMIQLQLDTVRKTMRQHSRRIGQKIVFIHGKGDGVLRKGVLALLRKEFPSCDIQDASFQEYGFGATLVTVHSSK